ICPSRIFRLRRTGRPASCRVENWRVEGESTLPETPPVGEGWALFPFPPLLPFPFFLGPPPSLIFVPHEPIWRIFCWASSSLAASRESFTSPPLVSIASYL